MSWSLFVSIYSGKLEISVLQICCCDGGGGGGILPGGWDLVVVHVPIEIFI